MRTAWLLVPLLLGCSNPSYTTIVVNPPDGTGGGGSSTTGGVGGSGGAATASSTSSATSGQGGAGGLGAGGAGADGGAGGHGGTGGSCAVDHDAICAALPGGVCGDVPDGCGGLTHCGNEACAGLECSGSICACPALNASPSANWICSDIGMAAPGACGAAGNVDIPAACSDSGRLSDDGQPVWCCDAAQAACCESDMNVGAPASPAPSFGNKDMYAWPFVPDCYMSVTRIELLTNDGALGIAQDNAGVPGPVMFSAIVPPTGVQTWLGATPDAPIHLAPGVTYWIIQFRGPQIGNLLSVSNGGVPIPHYTKTGANAWTGPVTSFNWTYKLTGACN